MVLTGGGWQTRGMKKPLCAGVVIASLLLSISCRTASISPRARDTTRIALVSDVHVTEGTNEAAHIHPIHLNRVLAAVKAAQVDLVLVAGDLTEAGRPWEVQQFQEKMAELNAPVWYVPGNHDVGNKMIRTARSHKEEITARRLSQFENKMGPSWWVREGAGVRVIGLNSGLYGSGTRKEAQMWKDLEQALASSNALPTLVLQHHPPFLKRLNEPGGDYFNMEPYPRLRLLAAAKAGGVRGILSGHIHRGLTNDYEGVLLYSTPPVAFGLPKGKQAEGWTLVTVTKEKIETEFRPIEH